MDFADVLDELVDVPVGAREDAGMGVADGFAQRAALAFDRADVLLGGQPGRG